MPSAGLITTRDAGRIGASVRHYERRIRSNVGPPLPPRPRGGSKARLLYIDSNRTRGEIYKVYPVRITSTEFQTASGSMALADIGTIEDQPEASFYNAQQGFGATTHVLTASPQRSRLVWGFIMGRDTTNNCPLYANNHRDTQAGC